MAAMSALANCTIWSRNSWSTITRVRPVRIAVESTKIATKIAAMRKPSVWKALIRTQNVAVAADGMDQFGGITAIHLAAKPAHMGFHDIGAGIEMQLPHIL